MADDTTRRGADAAETSRNSDTPGLRDLESLPVCRIETAEQFKAMSSPVRDQIMSVVGALAAGKSDNGTERGVSIREIAEQLGRKPPSLYRHLDSLVRAGLIREVGAQTSGGRDATTYAIPGERIMLVPPDREGPELDAMCAYIASVAAHAGRETVQATVDRVTGEHAIGANDTGGATLRGWLDDDQRAALRRIAGELSALFINAKRRPGTRLVAATLLFRPSRLPDGSIADAEPTKRADFDSGQD